MLQKIEKNIQKYVMMLITTKTHNERVKFKLPSILQRLDTVTRKRLLGKLQFHFLRKRFMGLAIEGAKVLILNKKIVESMLFRRKSIKLFDSLVMLFLRFFHFRFKLAYGMNVQTVDKRQLCAELVYITVVMRQIWKFFFALVLFLGAVNYAFCELGNDAGETDSQDLSLVVCVLEGSVAEVVFPDDARTDICDRVVITESFEAHETLLLRRFYRRTLAVSNGVTTLFESSCKLVEIFTA